MPVRLVTPPIGAEPVVLSDAKSHMRIDFADDDAYITNLITGARLWVEQVCWRGLVTQTYELVLQNFQGEDVFELGSRGQRWGIPNSFIELPRGNFASSGFLQYLELPLGQLQSVLSVNYTDLNGNIQTFPAANYTVDTVNIPGRIRLAYNQLWPAPRAPQWDAVRIQYIVGWADGPSVPQPIKQAIMLLVSQMYEFRVPEVQGANIPQLKFAFDALLDPYRLRRIG